MKLENDGNLKLYVDLYEKEIFDFEKPSTIKILEFKFYEGTIADYLLVIYKQGNQSKTLLVLTFDTTKVFTFKDIKPTNPSGKTYSPEFVVISKDDNLYIFDYATNKDVVVYSYQLLQSGATANTTASYTLPNSSFPNDTDAEKNYQDRIQTETALDANFKPSFLGDFSVLDNTGITGNDIRVFYAIALQAETDTTFKYGLMLFDRKWNSSTGERAIDFSGYENENTNLNLANDTLIINNSIEIGNNKYKYGKVNNDNVLFVLEDNNLLLKVYNDNDFKEIEIAKDLTVDDIVKLDIKIYNFNIVVTYHTLNRIYIKKYDIQMKL